MLKHNTMRLHFNDTKDTIAKILTPTQKPKGFNPTLGRV